MTETTAQAAQVAQVWGFFQVFLRVVALFAVAPVFGAREVPALVRVALALLASLVSFPLAAPFVSAPPPDLLGFVQAALGQTVIGLLMGMVVTLLFQAVLFAGDLIDLQMGFGMAAVFNPSLGTQSAMMGQFLYRYTILVFLLMNGHHQLLAGVFASFEALPLAKLGGGEAVLPLLASLVTTIFVVGLRIAAPAVATLLLVDVALALASRAVPQMNVFVVGMPLKVLVGLLVMAAAIGLITTLLQNFVGGAPAEMLHALQTLRR